MSLFSIAALGKGVVDQYSFITGYFTGSCISRAIYENLIKNNYLNLFVREKTLNQLAIVASPHLKPVTEQISKKILETTFTKEKLKYAANKLNEEFWLHPGQSLSNMKNLTIYVAKELAKKVTNNGNDQQNSKPNSSSKAIAFTMCKKAYNGEVSTAFQEAIIQSLTPMCEEAVQKALLAATKAVEGKAYDFSVNKICSIVVLPLVYGVAHIALEALGNYYQVPILNYLPKTSTIVAVSIGGHAIQMAEMVWREMSQPTKPIDSDKEDVKKTALKFLKESMSKKIRENNLLKALEMNITQEDIDQLFNTMISEAVDFYWKDMQETKVLGLPLVT